MEGSSGRHERSTASVRELWEGPGHQVPALLKTRVRDGFITDRSGRATFLDVRKFALTAWEACQVVGRAKCSRMVRLGNARESEDQWFGSLPAT